LPGVQFAAGSDHAVYEKIHDISTAANTVTSAVTRARRRRVVIA
jgi:hypothetical protein